LIRLEGAGRLSVLIGGSIILMIGLLIWLAAVANGGSSSATTASKVAAITAAPLFTSTPQAVIAAIPLATSTVTPSATAIPFTATPNATATTQAERAAADILAVNHLGAGNTLLQAHNIPGALNEYATAAAIAPWRQDTTKARDNAVAAATATAAAIPTATATAVPPTSTPAPQSMPAADLAYVRSVEPDVETATEALQQLTALSGEVSNDPPLLRNTDWETQAATQLAILQVIGERWQKTRDVPTDFVVVDRNLRQTGNEMVAMTGDYAYGVDHLDVVSIRSAAQHVNNIGTLMYTMTKQIEAIQQKYQ